MNNLKAVCPKCKFEYVIPLDRELIRTLPQNNLYWGIYVSTLAEHFGEFPEDMHEELKKMFNPKDSKVTPGERFGGTTTKMTRKEFTKYLESIKIWALTKYEVDLPNPEEINDPKPRE